MDSNSTSGNSTVPWNPNLLAPDQIDTINAVTGVTRVFSMLGSAFIVICFLALRRLRGSISFLLIFILSICDFLSQITDLVEEDAHDLVAIHSNGPPYTARCYVQAVGNSFFDPASILWTTAIACTLYATVKWRWNVEPTCQVMSILSLVCFGIPLILTVSAGAAGAFGPSSGWCFIVSQKAIWRFIVSGAILAPCLQTHDSPVFLPFVAAGSNAHSPILIAAAALQVLYIPLWICVVVNVVLYARVRWSIQKALRAQAATAENAASRSRIEAVIARLQLYPLVLIGVWSFASINRIFEAATGTQIFWLTLLHRTFSTSQVSLMPSA